MPADELRALLRLHAITEVGDRQLARLLARYSPQELLEVPSALLGPHGFERDSALTARRVDAALRTIEELSIRVWSVRDADYPQQLRTLEDPPPLLFARGHVDALGSDGVAVVGTRSPTEYGLSVARMLAFGVAEAGLVIWSGAARGIDSVAHRAALDAGGLTVAVLGSGIDVPYPRENARLLDEIARDGLLLSEFPPGTPPLAHNFPKRNRIIARMPKGVLIVEARVDGGALITAEQAADSRTVMAVPGPIGRPTSTGTNRLIQDGATLVMEVADVLECLGGPLNRKAAQPRPSARKRWTRVGLLKLGERDAQQPQLGEARTPVQPAPAEQGVGGTHDVALPLAPELARLHALLEPHTAIHIDDLLPQAGQPLPSLLGNLLRLINLGLVEDAGGKLFKLAGPRQRRVA